MLDRLSPRVVALLFAAVILVLLGLGYLSMAGSAVVVDETGGVERAYIVTSDGREQPLRRLWSGYFYAIPQLEGAIEVHCRDGSRKAAGYVTGGLDTRVRVVGDAPCARIVEGL